MKFKNKTKIRAVIIAVITANLSFFVPTPIYAEETKQNNEPQLIVDLLVEPIPEEEKKSPVKEETPTETKPNEIIPKTSEEVESISATDFDYVSADAIEVTQYDIFLLAQLIDHEAGIEPIEGQIAIAEIVKNRLQSDIFPDNIYDIVYQENPRQFSYNEKIKYVTPSIEQIYIAEAVLSGEISVLNNNDVLFYRNPYVTSDGKYSSKDVRDWGEYKYFCYIDNHAFYTYEGDE